MAIPGSSLLSNTLNL